MVKNYVADVVHQKYPRIPRLAYRKARESANQAGRERKSFLNRQEDPSSESE